MKGSNILFGRESNQTKIFLVDFGLCSKFSPGGLHKPYQDDRRWAHEGTMEYTSRDCHRGCFSRRGDMEVTLYNAIEWLGGVLPWEDLATAVHEKGAKPSEVHEQKIKAFEDPEAFLNKCFTDIPFPPFLLTMMVKIKNLAFEEKPDYEGFRDLLTEEMRTEETLDEVVLNIEMKPRESSTNNNSSSNKRGARTRRNVAKIEEEKENDNPKKKKARKTTPKEKKKSPAPKKNSKPATMVQTVANLPSHLSEAAYEQLRQREAAKVQEESMSNPTPAMLRQLDKMRTRRMVTPTRVKGSGGRGKKHSSNR